MAYKRGSGIPQLAGGILIDAVEEFDGFDGSGNTTAGQVAYRSYAGGGWPAHASITPNILAGMTAIAHAASGRILLEYVSAAARVTRVGGGTSFKVPAAQRFNDPASVPETMLRPFRRYTYEVPVRITVAGAPAVEIGIATSNGGLTFVGADPAFVFSSSGGVNWRPRSRRVTAGGITDGPISAAAVAAWHLLGIRYTEGLTPRIEFMIDGATVHTIQGDANMPVYASVANLLYPFQGVNSPAGTTFQVSMARFIVQEV